MDSFYVPMGITDEALLRRVEGIADEFAIAELENAVIDGILHPEPVLAFLDDTGEVACFVERPEGGTEEQWLRALFSMHDLMCSRPALLN